MKNFLLIIVLLISCNVFAQSDTTAPVLTYFFFTPDTVDVTAHPDTITFTIGAMDDLSGLSSGYFYFESPSTMQRIRGYPWFEQSSLADTVTGIIIIEEFSEAGDWTLGVLTLLDVIGNESYYTTSDLQAMGFPVTVTVTSIGDTTTAMLTYFSFTPDTVDVTAHPDTITFTIGAMDDLSGLSSGYFYFESPSTMQRIRGYPWFEQGSLADTVTGIIIIEEFSEAGDWTLGVLTLLDVIGNESYYTTSDLQAMGFPVTVTVTSIGDTTTAMLTYFSFTPDTVDVTAHPDTITFTIGAMDDLSGLSSGYFYFESPSTMQRIRGYPWFEQGSLADTVTGIIIIEEFSEAGDWTLGVLTLLDVIGNESYYTTSDLQAMGFPTILNVTYTVEVEEEQSVPETFALYQNYPNPFNPVTIIRYSLPIKSRVELVIYNTLGEKVRQLVNGEKETGDYSVELNATELPSGVYFYQLKAGNYTATKKMVLIK